MPETPNVHTDTLPADSLLQDRIAARDFIDCFSVASPMGPRDAANVIVEFPRWAQSLLRLRKLVTSPFGLSQDGPAAPDKIGPFPVEIETPHELIAGFNDKHLNFRVSVTAKHGKVSLATWVHPHNLGGKIYLRTILPFHIAIARNALKRVAATPLVN